MKVETRMFKCEKKNFGGAVYRNLMRTLSFSILPTQDTQKKNKPK